MSAVQRLAKWRVLFAGWQLGSRPKGDPECDAVSNHRELSILLRAEMSAMTGLLIEKGVFTAREFTDALEKEAEQLSKDYSEKFLGVTAHDDGLHLDLKVIAAAGTMAGWRP